MEKKRLFLRFPSIAPYNKHESINEYLKEVGVEADIMYMPAGLASTPPIKLTTEMLSEFKPHIIVVYSFEVRGPRYVITGELMDAAENLEMIQTWTVGFEKIDVEAATERGIYVCNNAEVPLSSESVAELTWAHILALARRLPQMHQIVVKGEWNKTRTKGQIEWNLWEDTGKLRGGTILLGKTLGIIGLGNIGSRVATIGKLGFNMRVLAYDPYIPPIKAHLLRVELVDLDTLLKKSDVISLHVPLTDETRGMIGEREISLMKPTAYLINTARGKCIDNAAMAKALEERRIYGAGIDCWPEEPPNYDNWWVKSMMNSKRVSATWHSGTLYDGYLARNKALLENIARFCRGEEPYWIQNPEVLWKLRRK